MLNGSRSRRGSWISRVRLQKEYGGNGAAESHHWASIISRLLKKWKLGLSIFKLDWNPASNHITGGSRHVHLLPSTSRNASAFPEHPT